MAQRTNEFGIRMALGARPNQVLSKVLGQGLAMSGFGALVGVVAAVLLTRFLGELLLGISSLDPATYVLMTSPAPRGNGVRLLRPRPSCNKKSTRGTWR